MILVFPIPIETSVVTVTGNSGKLFVLAMKYCELHTTVLPLVLAGVGVAWMGREEEQRRAHSYQVFMEIDPGNRLLTNNASSTLSRTWMLLASGECFASLKGVDTCETRCRSGLDMPSTGQSTSIVLVILELLLCLQIVFCDPSYLLGDRNIPAHLAESNVPRSDHESAVPCSATHHHANFSAAIGCPGSRSLKTNMSLHISYLHKQVSRSIRFPGSNEGRRLNTLKDYVYVADTPEADALAGDALDASIGGDIYSLGANEVAFLTFLADHVVDCHCICSLLYFRIVCSLFYFRQDSLALEEKIPSSTSFHHDT